MDAQTKRAIDRLTSELQRHESELTRIKRASRRPQLGHSSIDTGSLEVREPETGITRLRLGWQPDGTVGVVPEGGDPPPEPSRPTVEPIASGVRVFWDGELADGAQMPADFDHVNVHVSDQDGFTPTGATFQGTVHRDGGPLPVAPLEVGTRYYARLVGVGTGGVQGPASEQDSAVPESVSGIDPGSITETHIADDAISTPKLQAEAVTALKIAADQIEAGHIQAAAVTAAKLEGELVLGTRIVAGNPGGARVELDQRGLRGYSASDELAFVLDDTGDAVFSGRIQGAEIAGSRMRLGSAPGARGTVEAIQDQARIVMDSATGTRSQLVAHEGFAEFGVYSRGSDVQNSPVGMFWALRDRVHSTLQSRFDDYDEPNMLSTADERAVSTEYSSGNGSGILLYSSATQTSIALTPEVSPEGNPAATQGVLYSYRAGPGDIPLVTLQSPRVHEGPGQGRRSSLHIEGTNGAGRDRANMGYHANHHRFRNDTWLSVPQTEPGTIDIASTHSILSVRHRYNQARWQGVQPTVNTGGTFVEFTEDQWERIAVRTGASGAVRITIMAYGINRATNNSLLNISFGLGSFAADRSRSAEIRTTGTTDQARQACAIFYLDLSPETSYWMVPRWRLSSGTWTTSGAGALLSSLGDNSITAEALT